METASADGQPGLLKVTLAQTDGRPPEETLNAGLRGLIEAGIPLLSFELEGARLSDAFLAMTEAAERVGPRSWSPCRSFATSGSAAAVSC